MIRLEAMKGQLEAERSKLLEQLAELDVDLDVKPDYTLGAGDPAVYQWEFNLALRDQALEKLHAVEAALHRIVAGTYGRCDRCGQEIGSERLELLPSTAVCVRCAQSRR